jgi:hypothetical protein
MEETETESGCEGRIGARAVGIRSLGKSALLAHKMAFNAAHRPKEAPAQTEQETGSARRQPVEDESTSPLEASSSLPPARGDRQVNPTMEEAGNDNEEGAHRVASKYVCLSPKRIRFYSHRGDAGPDLDVDLTTVEASTPTSPTNPAFMARIPPPPGCCC